jgi:hypothetical protein
VGAVLESAAPRKSPESTAGAGDESGRGHPHAPLILPSLNGPTLQVGGRLCPSVVPLHFHSRLSMNMVVKKNNQSSKSKNKLTEKQKKILKNKNHSIN